METVMKKLFVLFLTLFTSAILFFSCDPHAEGNTVTINIDAEAIKSIFNNERTADTFSYRDACFYAVLEGSEGTKYEKTAYFTWKDSNDDGYSAQLTFTGVTYRETYNLYVYALRRGNTVAFEMIPNFELDRFGPTRKEIPLSFNPDLSSMLPPASFTGYLTNWEDNVPDGNYKVIRDYNLDCKVNNQANYTFEATIDDYYDYSFYMLHNGKQTNITPMVGFNSTLYFTYTFKEEGKYTAACRITDPESHVFATEYVQIEFKSNKMNTDFMIYSTGSSFSAKTSSSFSDSINSTDAYVTAIPSEWGDNPFDFCFDNNMNYYITDGNNVFKDPDYTSPYINPNTYNITAKKINYDDSSNLFTIYGSKNGTTGFGAYSDYSYNLNNWFSSPETNSGYTLINATIHGGKAYLFYNYNDGTYVSLILYVYDFFETNPGVLAFSGDPEKYRIFEKPYSYKGYGTPPSFDVGDVIVLDNNLYFLANIKYIEVDDQSGYALNHVYYFGFLGKINLGNMNVSLVGVSNITSKNETSNGFNNSKYYFNQTTQFISTAKEKNFSFPQKFIAIKPKELVIADDGYMFWGEGNVGYYKNLNRAVRVSLGSFAITDITVLDNIKWKFEATSTLMSGPAVINLAN